MSKGDGAILHGDSLEVLKDLPDNSVDAIVTDPPYGLSFMGKKWDYDVPSVELWKECLRVLKPGGHVLSFCGTRTYHRMVVNMEDAGFEIRDQLQWIYGSGFPKSQDVSKAIDKQAGAEREVVGKGRQYADEGGAKDRRWEGGTTNQNVNITAPATDAAKQWQGWGTALKPANEPICLARKPLEAKLTVAANVLKRGTGGLNIDASRIATNGEKLAIGSGKLLNGLTGGNGANGSNPGSQHAQGRWPANVLFDEEAAAVLDEQTQHLHGAGHKRSADDGTHSGGDSLFGKIGGPSMRFGDSGGASRFFYVAKASKRERNAGQADGSTNAHPTVKPVKLMEYLVRMITPPGGVVLDPFTGSGTTGVATVNLGFTFIGVEREIEYVKIAETRLQHAMSGAEVDNNNETDDNDEEDVA